MRRSRQVKFGGFHRARFAHPATDVHFLLSAAAGPRVLDKTDFLLRYVYYETLTATLRSLGCVKYITTLRKDNFDAFFHRCDPVSVFADFNGFADDFRKRQAAGWLAGAISLAATAAAAAANNNKVLKDIDIYCSINDGILRSFSQQSHFRKVT